VGPRVRTKGALLRALSDVALERDVFFCVRFARKGIGSAVTSCARCTRSIACGRAFGQVLRYALRSRGAAHGRAGVQCSGVQRVGRGAEAIFRLIPNAKICRQNRTG